MEGRGIHQPPAEEACAAAGRQQYTFFTFLKEANSRKSGTLQLATAVVYTCVRFDHLPVPLPSSPALGQQRSHQTSSAWCLFGGLSTQTLKQHSTVQKSTAQHSQAQHRRTPLLRPTMLQQRSAATIIVHRLRWILRHSEMCLFWHAIALTLAWFEHIGDVEDAGDIDQQVQLCIPLLHNSGSLLQRRQKQRKIQGLIRNATACLECYHLQVHAITLLVKVCGQKSHGAFTLAEPCDYTPACGLLGCPRVIAG